MNEKEGDSSMKKIDRVVVYGSLGLRPGLSELLWAFRKKHKLEEFPVYLDDHPFQLRDRIRRERENGMRTADVVLVPHYMALQLREEGVLARHHSAELDSYPREFRDASHQWFAIGVTFMSMAYNSKQLGEKDLPESLDDLSSGKMKGQLGMQSLTASKAGNLGAYYIAYLQRTVGSKKWMNLLHSLTGPNRPKTYDCIDHLLQGLLDGAVRIGLTVYSLAYFREKTSGSPVALLRMKEAPPMLTFTSAGLVSGAEDNGSARRFLDFLLSEDAQRIIGTIAGIAPTRPGISAAYPFELKYESRSSFHPDATDLKEISAALTTFKRLQLP
ncbi:MAG TPA: extracellular solute-binding protein [Nitrososphaerales archaeon]|nr:extracellular solute-binding protein [Nitrososphaerales archaeon]